MQRCASQLYSPNSQNKCRHLKTYPQECFNHVGNYSCIDDFLDLGVSACSDVGQSPSCLLLNIGFFVAQQTGEHGQNAGIQYGLSLLICPGDDVADGAQCRGLKEAWERLFYNLGAASQRCHNVPGYRSHAQTDATARAHSLQGELNSTTPHLSGNRTGPLSFLPYHSLTITFLIHVHMDETVYVQ